MKLYEASVQAWHERRVLLCRLCYQPHATLPNYFRSQATRQMAKSLYTLRPRRAR
jgi:hypothetical protein